MQSRQENNILYNQRVTRTRYSQGIVLLMDIRHPLNALDDQMLTWCQGAGLPVHVLLTKADKLSQNRAFAALTQTRHQLATRYGSMEVQPFSATSLRGKDLARLHSLLDGWLGFPGRDSIVVRTPS
jgi:GTP-binding protein